MREFFGNAEHWVGFGLFAFLAVVVFVGGFRKIAGILREVSRIDIKELGQGDQRFGWHDLR